MTNEEKAKEICMNIVPPYIDFINQNYKTAMEMAKFKDEQPIMEGDGWHTEQPTEDGWYLVDTPDFPKNCCCVVAEWDNDAKSFYDEHFELPIRFLRWKLIEKR